MGRRREADTGNTNITYNDDDDGSGLSTNVLYYYRVSAINAFGEGTPSAVANGPPLPIAPGTSPSTQ